MRIETELFIDRPPEVLWAALMDFENYPKWNPFVVSIAGDKNKGSKLKVKVKNPDNPKSFMGFNPIVIASDSNRYFAWKGQLFVPKLFDGVHYFLLKPAGKGTLFTHGEAFSGILVKAFGKKFFKNYKTSFDGMNVALARYLASK